MARWGIYHTDVRLTMPEQGGHLLGVLEVPKAWLGE